MSPASYRAAPPRVGRWNTTRSPPTDTIRADERPPRRLRSPGPPDAGATRRRRSTRSMAPCGSPPSRAATPGGSRRTASCTTRSMPCSRRSRRARRSRWSSPRRSPRSSTRRASSSGSLPSAGSRPAWSTPTAAHRWVPWSPTATRTGRWLRSPTGSVGPCRSQRLRARLITRRWIWLVPSKICITFASRM